MEKYSSEEISTIVDEINRQWEYHLVTRAAFYSGMKLNRGVLHSPLYYIQKDISYIIQLPTPLPNIMARGLAGVPTWLNQNYIIRLFGILERYGIIKAGKDVENPYTLILALLRHQVGVHTSGYRNPKKKEARDASDLIREHLDPQFMPDDITQFNLSIDTVLERLKNHCIEFVLPLEGQEKPDRSNKLKGQVRS